MLADATMHEQHLINAIRIHSQRAIQSVLEGKDAIDATSAAYMLAERVDQIAKAARQITRMRGPRTAETQFFPVYIQLTGKVALPTPEQVAEFAKALDEKDSELREMSILRGEYIQHLNTIRNLLKKVVLRPHIADQLNSKSEQRKLEVLEPEKTQDDVKEILKVQTLETEPEKTPLQKKLNFKFFS